MSLARATRRSLAPATRRSRPRPAGAFGARGLAPRAGLQHRSFRTKVPQRSSALKFASFSDETWNMQPSLSASPRTGGRQLVFTSSQAAKYLGVSLATIRRWTDAGHVSCYRTPGGQRRFSRDQLDTFIASMQRDSRGTSTTNGAHGLHTASHAGLA